MLTNNTKYYQQNFKDLNLSNQELLDIEFEQVTFDGCLFQDTVFKKCNLVDCEFVNCNLSLIKNQQSQFININFKDSKAVGVNWSKIKGDIGVSLSFHSCDISYSNFWEVNFKGSKIFDCIAKESTFLKADLRNCDCRKTDFWNAAFGDADLREADFRGAVNYYLDIATNKLKGAKFSSPEVLNLLKPLNIEIS